MIYEGFNEEFFVKIVDWAEPFSEESKEVLVNSLHHAALNDHIDEFMFVALGYVHLDQFLGTLLKIDCWLNYQINCSSQIDQVLLSQIVDLLLFFLLLHSLLLLKHLLFIIVDFFQVNDVFFP